ncbi:head-tail adaptor [Ralstonia phage RSB3]|uniref:Putative head-tail connector protein n=1 Tax=Ralstonia phage RSB3 TaxID=1402875 RepID=U3TK04_9CAUD|nr:head-tail adaptor [Ralstonia phage RSB3]BAN92345.1 putative head-tail connector protein [Ralstonia phage RSB3]
MTPTYKSLFEKYRDDSVILKSRQYAHWTLPKLMAELSHHGSAEVIERDYQEMGALLVNNLASKLTALLFPTNRPFFGINVSPALAKRAKEKGVDNTTLMSGLAQLEMEASQSVFLNSSYHQLTQAVAHLIVTGNALTYRDSKLKRTTTYGLQSFGIRRTGTGLLADCILREFESFAGLSRDVQTMLVTRFPHKFRMDRYDINVEVYTRITRVENDSSKVYYRVSQEIEGMPIGKPGQYPEHLCPWQAPVWSLVAGEHYGRGMIEDYAGGFASLSDKSEALALYGISAMKYVNLVQPGSGQSIDDLQNAETGDYVQGTNGAIAVQEAGDGAKITAMRAEIVAVFSNLARAFMYQANVRDAERVTAYELRQQAQEANTGLGGQYSALAESFQAPMAHVLLTEVKPELLEGIISGDMNPDIVAGLPALSRGIEVQNLLQAAQDAAAIVPPLMQLDNRIDPKKIMDVIYAGQSVDTTQFHRSKQEQEEVDNAKRQADAAQQQLATMDNATDTQTALAAANSGGLTQ